jgi:hypothetical protein
MKKMIKSGQEVIHDFLAEIQNVPSADPAIIDLLVDLYLKKRLTERSLQAAVDQFIQNKIMTEDE